MNLSSLPHRMLITTQQFPQIVLLFVLDNFLKLTSDSTDCLQRILQVTMSNIKMRVDGYSLYHSERGSAK